MIYLIYSLFLFFLQSFLIITTRINIFPELFFFPWLVSKGLVPYKDFFDHHGFLLYYVLAPLMQDKSLSLLKLFYFGIQTVNLVLILAILKKVSNRIGFILGGGLFVLVNYFVTDGNLWYELVITSLYLLIFLILLGKLKYKNQILGILAALVSFIKPTAAVILFPVLFVTKSMTVLINFSLSWIIALVYFWSKNGLRLLIDNLFAFNSFLSKNYRDSFFSDEKFLVVSGLIIIFAITLHVIQKKTNLMIPTILFFVSGFVFIFYSYARYHLVPVAAFFALLVGQTIKSIRAAARILFIVVLIMYTVFLGRKVKFQYFYLKAQTPWIENRMNNAIVSELKDRKLADKKIYVFGNNAEIYYLLHQLPPTKYPLLFPLMDRYIPNFETKLINELNQNKVEIIIIPKPVDKRFINLTKLRDYIYKNYLLLKRDKDFEVYIR